MKRKSWAPIAFIVLLIFIGIISVVLLLVPHDGTELVETEEASEETEIVTIVSQYYNSDGQLGSRYLHYNGWIYTNSEEEYDLLEDESVLYQVTGEKMGYVFSNHNAYWSTDDSELDEITNVGTLYQISGYEENEEKLGIVYEEYIPASNEYYKKLHIYTKKYEEWDADNEPSPWSVKIKIEENDVSETGTSIVVYNYSEWRIYFTEEYALQVLSGEEWVDVEPVVADYDWNTEVTSLLMDDTGLQVCDWSELYGSLPAGTYRVSKTYSIKEDEGSKQYEMESLTFEIE